MLLSMIAIEGLTYRTIDPDHDIDSAFENYRAACIASYGSDAAALTPARYRAWLRGRVDEFPDGHVFALLGDMRIGQLELQAPYGLPTGYINLYAVSAPFRGMGFGKLMHRYVERYFRSWEAREVELDVSPTNEIAVRFYRSLGYRTLRTEGRQWRMVLELCAPAQST
jgi:ribosomal protein S18 acetylase RimI-like enzyme